MTTAEEPRPASVDGEPLQLPSDQEASGRSFGEAEVAALREVIESGTLTSTKGSFTRLLEEEFCRWQEVEHAWACSSGTSAIHTAVAALDLEPGDEMIVSPITDMGAIAPVLYQGQIPVFADVDPVTLNVTAETIEARISERTRAVMVTHLFGQPCAMDPIVDLARAHDLRIIEDCAQAWGARSRGRKVGTLGDLACYSLQQGKHVTCGEGGLVATSDEALSRRCFLFVNKAWGYGDARPDHYFLALNSRLSELQSAVALAQLRRLPDLLARRIAAAERLTQELEGTPGLGLPTPAPGDVHSYWRYALHVDPEIVRDGPIGLAERLRTDGIFTAPRYIQKPAYRCAVIARQQTFGSSRYPFSLARPEAVDYRDELFPGTLAALETVLVVPWNEGLSERHVVALAERLRQACRDLMR